MYPDLSTSWLHIAIQLFGALVVIFASSFMFRRLGYPARPILSLVFNIACLGMIIGGFLYGVALHWAFEGHGIPDGSGYRYTGAVIGFAVGCYIGRRQLPEGLSLSRFADLFAPFFVLMQLVGRFACLFSGCCYGAVSSLDWTMRYPRFSHAWQAQYSEGAISWFAPASLPVHPLPIYLMAGEAALVAFCFWYLRRRRAYDGKLALIVLAAHGLLKATLEGFRHEYHLAHQAIALLAVGALVLLLVNRPGGRRGASPTPALSSA